MKGPRKTEVFQKIHQFKSQQLKAINSIMLQHSVIITKLFNSLTNPTKCKNKTFLSQKPNSKRNSKLRLPQERV